MREELIALTKKEHDRLAIIRRLMRRELMQKDAAEFLELSTRQVRNLVRKVERDGARGLAHGNRSRPSPRREPKAQAENPTYEGWTHLGRALINEASERWWL